MTACPAGHETQATDYCDVCGLAVVAVAPTDTSVLPVVPPDGATDPGGVAAAAGCPNCAATNPVDALFCEACGYDFTTGSLPRPASPADAGADPGADAGADAATTSPPADPNPSPTIGAGWVAEIWIDPDWYADQKSTDALPSPGLPVVVPLRHQSILLGRASRSRGITPDIDLSSDNGISRRHAQLTTDGTRWWVEDLGSSNGTYVGSSVGPVPTRALPQGQRQEIAVDDRIYLGAWTRVVVRKASPGEV